MNWGMLGGWIGGIAGAAMGLLGGVIGTYFSIKNTSGPRERAFMIKAAILCWVFVGLFCAGMWLIPSWYKMLLVVPYVAILLFCIRWGNATQSRIRREESGLDAK